MRMTPPGKLINVCVCTYKRPGLLRRCLEAVTSQETNATFSFSIIVADNDLMRSAEEIVSRFAYAARVPVRYCVEPSRNIALARNKALEHAKGDFIAFIDDDEFPAKDWLLNLLKACISGNVDGVLGPVDPHFESEPPKWVTRGKFFDRPRHPTGYIMDWRECRTGNVLFRRQILDGIEQPFRPEFGTGSEDVDFFRRMTELGRRFIWCNEALTWEVVPPSRWKRSFMLKRGLLRGKNARKHPRGRVVGTLKSLIAIPAYILALPFLLAAGHHYFMRYLVKLCDHTGKVLAFVGLNLIREREM